MKLLATLLLASPALAQSVTTTHPVDTTGGHQWSVSLPGAVSTVTYHVDILHSFQGTGSYEFFGTVDPLVHIHNYYWLSEGLVRTVDISTDLPSNGVAAASFPFVQDHDEQGLVLNGAPAYGYWPTGIVRFEWFTRTSYAWSNADVFHLPMGPPPITQGHASIEWTPDTHPSTPVCSGAAPLHVLGDAEYAFLSTTVEPNQFAMVVRGTSALPGAGQLCIGAPERLFDTVQQSDASGQYTARINVDPGTTYSYQVWFREPGGTSGLSDAVEVTFQ